MSNSSFDQAIFTSVRTPMGEGYRVIAASAGLRSDEKQVITRFSPSHQGLCMEAQCAEDHDELAPGLAFYRLPSDRLCLAISCFAGAERTARGGKRIYTHNVVLTEPEFAAWNYNPFDVARAAVRSGATEPHLKPEKVLQPLELDPPSIDPDVDMQSCTALLESHGAYLLENVLVGKRMVVTVEDGWSSAAEALMLGLPASLRAHFSFAAGLQFSVGRTHLLTILHDPKKHALKRAMGQPVEYIDPQSGAAPLCNPSGWTRFVMRHWAQGELKILAQRTGRRFRHNGPNARNTVGEAYDIIDTAPFGDLSQLLAMGGRYIIGDLPIQAPELAAEVRAILQGNILEKMNKETLATLENHWPMLHQWWSGSDEGARFATPLLNQIIKVACAQRPLEGAALLARAGADFVPACVHQAWEEMVDFVIDAVFDWSHKATENDVDEMSAFCEYWAVHRPKCEPLARVKVRCDALRATAGTNP